MEDNPSIPFEELQYSAELPIPFDLFVSKEYNRIGTGGFVKFTDSGGNMVYKVQKLSGKPPGHSSDYKKKLIVDASGNTLFTIIRVNLLDESISASWLDHKGSWQGFRGSNDEELIFTVEKIIHEFTRTEFKILLVTGDDNGDLKTELHMKGSPFQRACTIYKGDSIAAQTSLMYKLGFKKLFVPRSRFRVTIFPGFIDSSLVASLIVIYFEGRKLWI